MANLGPNDAIRLAKVRRLSWNGEARAILRAHDVPAPAAAEAIGVAASTVWRWTAGISRPTGSQALAFLDLLEQLLEEPS